MDEHLTFAEHGSSESGGVGGGLDGGKRLLVHYLPVRYKPFKLRWNAPHLYLNLNDQRDSLEIEIVLGNKAVISLK